MSNVSYQFHVLAKLGDANYYRIRACLESLLKNLPRGVELRYNVEEYFETQYEQRRRAILDKYGGVFRQHTGGCLLFAEATGAKGEILYFRNHERFLEWAKKLFSYTDTTHQSIYMRSAKTALRSFRESTGRSYRNISLKVNDEPEATVEVELFNDLLPTNVQAFLTEFENDTRKSRVVRIKKDSFIHIAPTTSSPVLIQAESFNFTHSFPGLLGFCMTPDGRIDASQWYITLHELHRLDGKFMVFGRVISGMRAFWRLAKQEVNWDGKFTADAKLYGPATKEEENAAPEAGNQQPAAGDSPPEAAVPVAEAPAADAPAVETPAVETPAVAPAAETPAVEAPPAEATQAEVPQAEAPAEAPVEEPTAEA